MAGSYTYYTYYTYCTYYTYQVAAYMAGRIDTPHVYRTAARVYHGVEQACAWHGTSRHVHGTARHLPRRAPTRPGRLVYKQLSTHIW